MGCGDDELGFCWDPAKAALNLKRHKVSFEAATFIFDDPMRFEEDDRFARGEYRNLATGSVDGNVLTVVYAAVEENLYRIISARLATAEERRVYERRFIQT